MAPPQGITITMETALLGLAQARAHLDTMDASIAELKALVSEAPVAPDHWMHVVRDVLAELTKRTLAFHEECVWIRRLLDGAH